MAGFSLAVAEIVAGPYRLDFLFKFGDLPGRNHRPELVAVRFDSFAYASTAAVLSVDAFLFHQSLSTQRFDPRSNRPEQLTSRLDGMPIRVRMEPIIGSELLIATMEVCAVELRDFDKVVEAYWERIYRFVLASLRDQDAAQTVTQECFLRAYRGRHRYRGDASVHTWLISIAINLVRSAGRNRRFQFWKRVVCLNGDQQDIAHWMPDKAVSAETRLVMEQQLNAVWAASAELPKKQRTVFLLRYVEDMDLLEIAAALGVSEGTVKVHLFRAIRSVRKKVGV